MAKRQIKVAAAAGTDEERELAGAAAGGDNTAEDVNGSESGDAAASPAVDASDPDKNFALVILRSLSHLFRLTGYPDRAMALRNLAEIIEANLDIDEHMERVAHALKTNDANDWDGVVQRIQADRARLHA